MAPDTRSSISESPAALPPVSKQPEIGAVNPVFETPVTPSMAAPPPTNTIPLQLQAQAANGGSSKEQAMMQMEQLITQLGHDPYKLAAAMQQLKSNYLLNTYNIELKAEK